MKKTLLVLLFGLTFLLASCNKTTETFDITYVTNGGTFTTEDLALSTIEDGRTISEPAITKEGFTLSGWYSDSTYNTVYDFTKPVLGDLTIYAKWDANSYTVTYYGLGEQLYQETYQFGDTVNIPTSYELEGYNFFGVYQTNDFMTQIHSEYTMPSQDTDLYLLFQEQANALTIGNDVFVTVDDITITNQELWDEMKLSDGLTYLNRYIEQNLLSSQIDAVTQAQIDTEITKAIYGTTDLDVIAEIQRVPNQEDDMIISFERSLVLMGYDPTNTDDVRSYFELQIARQEYTKDYITGLSDGHPLYISDEDVEEYYNTNTKGDVCAIVVRFANYNEMNSVFDKFNLVPDFNGGLGSYWASTPIEDLPTSAFSDENTDLLTDQEALKTYITLYNYMNPTKPQLDDNTTLESFCATYTDGFTFSYADFTHSSLSNSYQNTFANYLWNTLSVDPLDENATRYSANGKTISDFKIITFKVDEELIKPYSALTVAEKDALYEEILDSTITQSTIALAISSLWDNYTFEIFDPTLKLQKKFSDGTEFDNHGSNTLLASIGNDEYTLEVTSDELFNYMVNLLGTPYTIQLIQSKYLIESDYYTALYGESRDVLQSDNEELVGYREELAQIKSNFLSNLYANYGFSNTDFTWDEFLMIAFGSMSESDVLRELFIVGELQPYLSEEMISYSRAVEYIQAQVDEYFSLNVEHLLLYLDTDYDFVPDEFKDYTDGLTPTELATFNSLVVDFEDLIKEKINNDGYTFNEIISEYKDGLIDDENNEYRAFKAYGFHIITEDLGELTSANSANFDADFVTALKRIYDDYVLDLASDSTLTEYYDDRLVESFFGLHFIHATEGTYFDQPTAVFDNANDSYDPGFVGTTIAPNESQIDLYSQILFADRTSTTLNINAPLSVMNAISIYYDEIYETYFTNNAYTIATAAYILDHSPVFTNDQTDHIAFLESVCTILYEVTFPEEYITPSEDN